METNAFRLKRILQALAIGDDVIRNNACDEALSFIDSLHDADITVSVRSVTL